jgi:DNA-binding Lrp family transcriptional regulator
VKPADYRILAHIRNNARMNLTTMSRETGIPVSTIFDRLRAHERTFVQRFTALVDFAKLGYPVKANIFLKVEPSSREGLKTHLLLHKQVNTLVRINNGFDFAAECLFTSLREAEEFIEDIELQFSIADKAVFHIIDEMAREKMLAKL